MKAGKRMLTKDQLEAQRTALKSAMRSGALSVQHGDKRVQYRTMAEMREALAGIEDDLAAVEGRRRRRVFYAGTDRGF